MTLIFPEIIVIQVKPNTSKTSKQDPGIYITPANEACL